MLNGLLKIAAPLVLCFALLFMAGAASAVDFLGEKPRADLCCPSEAESRESADTHCSESDCRCLSCTVPLIFMNALNSPVHGVFDHPPARGGFIPIAPVSPIDYPPELS